MMILDILGTMTVREHLVFQARLRMHKHIPMPERMKRVDEVLQEVRQSVLKCGAFVEV